MWICGNKKKKLSKVQPIPQKKLFKVEYKDGVRFICHFCGGKSCHHENHANHPSPAIKGLHSDWITNEILATQRPSTRLIKEFDIPKLFRENYIFSIFNLQEPGEHPYCGDGIEKNSGFSYQPEDFYKEGIYFYNFGWRDHTATQNPTIFRVVKTIDYALQNGKRAAFHCHAGRGRTGLIICAYLIYSNHMTAEDSIALFQGRRFGKALTNTEQLQTLKGFEKYIKETQFIFFKKPEYNLNELVVLQMKVRPIVINDKIRRVPWLINTILGRFEAFIESKHFSSEKILKSFYNLNDISLGDIWSNKQENQQANIKDKVNNNTFEISQIEDPRFLSQLVLDFFDQLNEPSITEKTIKFLEKIGKKEKIERKISVTLNADTFGDLQNKKNLSVSKNELYLLMRIRDFLRYFSQNFDTPVYKWMVVRICISLLNLKNKYGEYFHNRDLVNYEVGSGPKAIEQLMTILDIWIKSEENDAMPQNIKVQASPMKGFEYKRTLK